MTGIRAQLWIVAFGFFMQTLDTTIVNTALPSMAASLGHWSGLHWAVFWWNMPVGTGYF